MNEQAIANGEDFKALVEDFHKISGYFNAESYIHYETDVIDLEYKDGQLYTRLKPGLNYRRQKICYIPSERNVVTLPELQGFEFGTTNLRSFLFDWLTAREYFDSEHKSDILGLGVKYYYDNQEKKYKDRIEHENGESYQIPLASASSGLQSAIPLLVMLTYYSNGYFERYGQKVSFDEGDKSFRLQMRLIEDFLLEPLFPNFDRSKRDEYTRKVTDELGKGNIAFWRQYQEYRDTIQHLLRPYNTSFIIEEPEQNLFPYSQMRITEALIQACTKDRPHEFTITTHSPYIVNFLNVLIARYYHHSESVSLDPDDLNVFAVQDGTLVNQMMVNEVTGQKSVNVEDLTDAMREMYNEYRMLKNQ